MRRIEVSSLRAAQVLIPVALLLLAGLFVVSPGIFNIDEFVEFAGAKAFLATGSFAVPNGLPRFASPDLNLWILVAGPHGLTPQYPPGVAVLGAPLLALFGVRGLMLINVLAGIGTLFALWSLGKRHFGGTAVALVSVLLLGCATFWIEYVFAIWPHSVSVFCVTLALLFTLDGLEAEPPADLKAGLAAGAAIGFGLLFRTDTILALPVAGLGAILLAKRPFRLLIWIALGLVPFVVLASLANHAKFGTFNPLSYGHSGGNTDIAAHLAPIAALALVSLLLLGARVAKWRPGRREYVLGLAVLVLVLALSAAARGFAERYLTGAWGLVVDSTTIQDQRPGVQPMPGGILSFWGMWKKALGQSMPWLGLLLLAVHTRKDEALRRAQWMVLILAAVWSLPFFMTQWHGGMGSNMRYLLPLAPALCALSARYLIDFARPIPRARRVLLFGAIVGGGAVAVWTGLLPTKTGGAQQILSTWILLATAALALLSGIRWAGQAVVRTACLGAVGAGLAASVFYMAADLGQAQFLRAFTYRIDRGSTVLPDRTLAYVPASFIARWAFQPGHLAAMPDSMAKRFDYALIDKALAENYRVLVFPLYATGELRTRYGARLVRSGVRLPNDELLEIKPAASAK